MKAQILSKWQRLAIVALTMAASVIAALCLYQEELSMQVAGRVALVVALFGMLWGVEMIDGRKKEVAYLFWVLLVGNAIIWPSASFVESHVLDLITGTWIATLCFRVAFMRKWELPEGVNMPRDLYSGFVGLFQLMEIALILYIISQVLTLF